MAIGSFRGQLEGAISKRLTADPYEKRQQAAQADYQAQAEKSRQDLSERLNRLGVLRGSGKTASQFGEFESGVLRGQQALGAQFEAQREAGIGQAIQQGIGMYGTTGQLGIAGQQQREAERMGQFSRDLGTRQFLSQDELSRDRQREAERSAQVQEGFQRAGVTGLYGGNRTVDQQRQDLSHRLGLAQTFGTDLGGDDVTRQTEARAQRTQQEAFQRAGITGKLGDDRTLAAQQLYGSPEATTTLQGQELELRRGELLGEIDDQDTLAREAQREDRDLQAILGQAQLNQQTAERGTRVSEAALDRAATAGLQTAQFGEAALEREARVGESQADRELRAIQSQQQYNLTRAEGAAERTSRAALQQTQFGEDARGRAFQQTESTRDREFQMQMRASELEAQGVQAAEARKLAREELYGSANPMEWDRTLASTGQRAQIAAENRRLAEMETAGASQRGLAEREFTQRSAMAAQQRALEREQLYGRRMTREEEMAGGYAGGTLGAQELTQRESEARLDRQAQADLLAQSGRQDITRDTGMNRFNLEMEGARQEFERGERGLDRALTRDESAEAREMQGYLANVDRIQQEHDRALRGELGRGQLAQDARRTDLSEAELMGYTEDASGRRHQTEGARAERARLGMQGQDLALRRQLGEGQLAQDTRRTDLARDELRGYTELPSGYREETLGSREARLGRGLEGRRLDEIERAGLVAEQADRDRIDLAGEAGEREAFRNQLAEEAQYGGGQRRGATFAAQEAGRVRAERQLDRDIDTRRTDLAEQAQYGYRTDEAGEREDTLANTIATREQADRATALGYDSRRVAEAERSGRAQRSLQRRELDWRQDQQATDNALRAIGVRQTEPEGYHASDQESAILDDMILRGVPQPSTTTGLGHEGFLPRDPEIEGSPGFDAFFMGADAGLYEDPYSSTGKLTYQPRTANLPPKRYR